MAKPSVPTPVPTVTTDLLDYLPGSTATITASNFIIGSTLKLEVLHVTAPGSDGVYGTFDDVRGDNSGAGHEAWYVTDGVRTAGADGKMNTADDGGDLDGKANGTVLTSWYVNPDDSSGATFLLTATGINVGKDGKAGTKDDKANGQSASTAFTDQDPTVDLTAANAAPGTINGAVFEQFFFQPAGTGFIDSFVRIQAQGNASSEQGYNTDHRPLQFNENSSPNFTRSLLLTDVPTELVNGVVYREFLLDINEPNSANGRLLSLDALQIYLGEGPALNAFTGSPTSIGSFSGNSQLVYDMDEAGDAWVALNGNLASGSGESDIRVLIPDSLFDAVVDDLPFVYLYSAFGFQGGNFRANSGFEEWAVIGGNAPPEIPVPPEGFFGTRVSEEGLPNGIVDMVGVDDLTDDALVPGTIPAIDADPLSFTFLLPIFPTDPLASGGEPITWVLSDGDHTLTGSAGLTPIITINIEDDFFDFTAVDSDGDSIDDALLGRGDYLVTLLGPIDHLVPNVEDEISFMVGVRVSDGANIVNTLLQVVVEDDSPVVTVAEHTEDLRVDESAGPDTVADPNAGDEAAASLWAIGLGTVIGYDTAAGSALFEASLGADDGTTEFTLTGAGGVALVEGAVTGLTETATGDAVTLHIVSPTEIHGVNTTNALVFALNIDDTTGVTELAQYSAVVHNDPLDHDEAALSSEFLDAGVLFVTATTTDNDGDTAQASVDLVDMVAFEDDGPSISLAEVEMPVLTTDDTEIPDSAGPTSFAGLFTPDFGEDGFKDANDDDAEDADAVSYALGVSAPDANSGLVDTLTGDAVLLNLVGNDVVGTVNAGATEVFRVSVDLNSAEVSLNQSRAVVHDDPLDPDEGVSPAVLSAANLITLTATITDGDGDTNNVTANIGTAFAFEDDGPTISLAEVEIPILTTDDTEIPDSAGPTSFAGLFTPDFGEDGFKDANDDDAEDADAVSYALGVSAPDANSGLVDTLTGDAVLLNLVGNDVVGTVNAGATEVFRVSVDLNSAEVSLSQSRSVVHNDPTDPDETGGSAAMLSAANLITLTATITDGDGDTNNVTANIGTAFAFEDDGPTISLAEVEIPILTTDDTEIPDSAGPTSFAGLFTPDFGEDGFKDANDDDAEDADAVSYALGVSAPDANSGLVDTLTGDAVLLNLVGNDVVGTVNAGATEVFRVSVDLNSAEVSLSQSRSVVHNDPTDPDETGGSAAMLSAANLITLTATITDGDGDTNNVTANIGTAFAFEDDGPTISLAEVEIPILTTDDTEIPDSAGPTSFAGLFTPDFGEDGFKDANDDDAEDADAVSYALGVSAPDANSGLVDTLTGDAVLLNLVGNDVVGTVNAGATEVFRVSVDLNSAEVSLSQSRSVVHNDPTDPDETGGSAAMLSAANLITLTATITDGDGDTNNVTANIGTAFAFEDDGPTISLAEVEIPILTTDDTEIPDSAGPTSFAGLFTPDFGEDGFKDANDDDAEDADAVSYALGVSAPDANSGLVDTLTGDAVLLNLVGNDVVGTVNAGATEVFRVSVDLNSAEVSLSQSRSVVHNDPTDPDETGGSAAMLSAANLITLTATITDGDGDTNNVTANIGTAFAFEDDGPTISLAEVEIPILTTDDTEIPDSAGPTSFAGLFTPDFGEDGFKDANDDDAEDADAVSYALGVSAPDANSGLVDTLTGDAVLLNLVGNDVVGTVNAGATEVFRVSVDLNSAEVSLSQSRSVVHNDPTDPDETGGSAAMLSAANLITLTATITDGDGDTNNVTANIGTAFAFEDDGPTANDFTRTGATVTAGTNLMLILDVSGSMSTASGVGGLSRLDMMKQSVEQLIDAYDTLGDVKVRIVTFNSFANEAGAVWTDVATAKTTISGLTSGGTTNYDDALNTAWDAFGDSGKLGVGSQNVSYFLSDGLPNDNGLSAPAHGNLGGGSGIDGAEAADWAGFLNDNDIISFALGMGPAAPQSALDPIAWNGIAETDMDGLVVDNFADLATTLISTLSALPITGSLLTDSTPDGEFGADGAGYIKSITVDGTTYTYDPAGNAGDGSITFSGGVDHGSFATTDNELTVTVNAGGSIKVDMDDGDYIYTPPSMLTGDIDTDIGFVLADSEGDTDDAVLTIFIDVPVKPETNAGSGSGDEDDPSIPVALSGTDSDGSVASFKIMSLPAGGTLYRDAGLTDDILVDETIPAIGNAATVYFVPNLNFNGSPTFLYASIDDEGLQDLSPATATITVAPDAGPVANADTILTAINNDGTFLVPRWALLANDDPGTDGPASISSVTTSDSQLDSVSLSGSNVSVDTDGSFDPPDMATFSYVANDESLNSDSSPAIVTVNAVANANITGTGGSEIIVDNNNAHTVDAGGGNDVLIGNGGADTLTGGSGADGFVFNTRAGSGDSITDFLSADDLLSFEDSEFPLANLWTNGISVTHVATAGGAGTSIAGADLLIWDAGAVSTKDTAGEINTLLDNQAGTFDGGVFVLAHSSVGGNPVALYYDQDADGTGGGGNATTLVAVFTNYDDLADVGLPTIAADYMFY